MRAAGLVVGVLVACGSWFAFGAVAAPRLPVWARGTPRGPEGPAGRDGLRRGRVRPSWPRVLGGAGPRDLDLAAVLTEVSSRLRAGEPVERAWRRTIERRGLAAVLRISTVPPHGDRGSTPGSAVEGWAERVGALDLTLGADRPDASLEAQVGAARAAIRLAERVGAPLADVLDRCAEGIVETGQAEAARRVALAGPASTARLLAWLPLGGLVLGGILGADPVGTLLDGGPGTLAGLAGFALLLVGRRWSRALVEAARRPGGSGATGRPGRDPGRRRGRRVGRGP